MTGVSLERLADTLYPKPDPKYGTAYGTVEGVNPDGSYQVKLNASATNTRCAKLCDAEVGDRVLVLIQANGHCAALGRVGGSVRASSVDSIWDSGSTSSVGALNLSIDWSPYKALIITVYSPDGAGSSAHYDTNVVDVGYTPARIIGNRELPFFRTVTLTPGTVGISGCNYYSQYNSNTTTASDDYCIPVSIKGVY